MIAAQSSRPRQRIRDGTLVLACCGALAIGSGASSARAQRPTLSDAVQRFVAVDTPVVALTHARVIDGTGAPAKADQTIIIRDGRIASIGSFATTRIPGNARQIDLTGEVGDPRARDGARASLLPHRPRRLRQSHRVVLATVSRRRRDVDAHRGKHERHRRDQSQEVDRRRRARRAVDRRDRAVPRGAGTRPRPGSTSSRTPPTRAARSTTGTTSARRRSRRTCTSRATSSARRSTKGTSAA